MADRYNIMGQDLTYMGRLKPETSPTPVGIPTPWGDWRACLEMLDRDEPTPLDETLDMSTIAGISGDLVMDSSKMVGSGSVRSDSGKHTLGFSDDPDGRFQYPLGKYARLDGVGGGHLGLAVSVEFPSGSVFTTYNPWTTGASEGMWFACWVHVPSYVPNGDYGLMSRGGDTRGQALTLTIAEDASYPRGRKMTLVGFHRTSGTLQGYAVYDIPSAHADFGDSFVAYVNFPTGAGQLVRVGAAAQGGSGQATGSAVVAPDHGTTAMRYGDGALTFLTAPAPIDRSGLVLGPFVLDWDNKGGSANQAAVDYFTDTQGTEGTWRWRDITSKVRGLEFSHGADEPYGFPRMGEATITLDAREDRELDVFLESPDSLTDGGDYANGTSQLRRPGTIVRFGLRSPTDTRCAGWMRLGFWAVDSWETITDALGRERYTELRLADALSLLGPFQEPNPLSSVSYYGESADRRLERLLDAAGWPFGVEVEAAQINGNASTGLDYSVEGTDLSMGRLEECQLTAETVDAFLIQHGDGRAMLWAPKLSHTNGSGAQWEELDHLRAFSVRDKGTSTPDPMLWLDYSDDLASDGNVALGDASYNDVQVATYLPDSWRVRASADNVVNDVRATNQNGDTADFQEWGSIRRYGRRTVERSDWLAVSTSLLFTLVSNMMGFRALQLLELAPLRFATSDHLTEDQALALISLRRGHLVAAYPPDGRAADRHYTSGELGERSYLQGEVRSIVHRITPRGKGITWETDLQMDVERSYQAGESDILTSDRYV